MSSYLYDDKFDYKYYSENNQRICFITLPRIREEVYFATKIMHSTISKHSLGILHD